MSLVTFLLVLALCPEPVWAQIRTTQILPLADEVEQCVFAGLANSGDTIWVLGRGLDPVSHRYHPFIERSLDGGVTWIRNSMPIFEQSVYNEKFAKDLFNLGSSFVVAYGDSGLVYFSSDGGDTWEDRSAPGVQALADCSFFDSINGVVVGVRSAYFTSDCGNQWRPLPRLAHQHLTSVKMFSPTAFSCFAQGEGVLYYSSDGGRTFDSSFVPQSQLGESVFRMWRAHWLSADTVVVVGTAFPKGKPSWPVAIRTTDRGQSWKTVYARPSSSFSASALAFGSSSVGGFGGRGDGVYFTTDAGENWHEDALAQRYSLDFHALKFVNPSTVLVTVRSSYDVGFLLRLDLSASRVETTDGKQFGISYYPNPCEDLLRIRKVFRAAGTIHIYDLLGRAVQGFSMPEGVNEKELDCSNLPPGMFTVVFSDAGSKDYLGRFLKR